MISPVIKNTDSCLSNIHVSVYLTVEVEVKMTPAINTTIVDSSAAEFQTIFVSAGRRGLEI